MARMKLDAVDGVVIDGPEVDGATGVLTTEALTFVRDLHREFRSRRSELLARRQTRQKAISGGQMPDFLSETANVRSGTWQVAPAPADLNDRRVEITGPAERKMMINALNSGAKVFMADLEDSLSPTWSNIVTGQIALSEAIRRTLRFTNPDGKAYELKEQTATLLVRPRGWHLLERHMLVDNESVSASLFDFGMYFFHNASAALAGGTGPYFYLPKLESHLEARLWNDVFVFAQSRLGIPHGTIRATVLIETILAAFEMEEILFELKDHAAGLNAGRWDYIFSIIKKFRHRADLVLPDRAQITMTVPFMRAYTELLVRTCHTRGAHAIGGMSAFIPTRKDPVVNETAISKVREDKLRESSDGFDGTWVAHPDLVPVALGIFDNVLGTQPNQKHKTRRDVSISSTQLAAFEIPGGRVTEAGVRLNINIALQYLDAWLRGIGAAAIHNLMEDAATAEISRAQLFQWIHNNVVTQDGQPLTRDRYLQLRALELDGLQPSSANRLNDAASLLDDLVLGETFHDFLTVPAYARID